MQEKVDYISSLIVKYLRETLTDAERQALEQWRSESEINQRKFEELTNESIVSERVNMFTRYDQEAGWRKVAAAVGAETPVVSMKPQAGYRRLYAIAAAIALLLAVGGWYFFIHGSLPAPSATASTPEVKHGKSVYKNDIQPGSNKARLTLADGSEIVLNDANEGLLSEQGGIAIRKTGNGKLEYQYVAASATGNAKGFNSLTTPAGGQFQVKLPDGSMVWLNAATVIRFPVAFSGNNREIELTGEAYFEVASQKVEGHKVPFRVKVGNNTAVEVLGTHFNVSSYGDEGSVKTTLLEGAVKVTQNNKSSILKPGQQAEVNKSGEIKVIKEQDTDEAVAWKKGEFRFEKADIKEVMRQIARWYNVDVAFEGDMSNVHFSGSMSRNINVTKVLDMLQLTGEVRFVVEDRKITVMPY